MAKKGEGATEKKEEGCKRERGADNDGDRGEGRGGEGTMWFRIWRVKDIGLY